MNTRCSYSADWTRHGERSASGWGGGDVVFELLCCVPLLRTLLPLWGVPHWSRGKHWWFSPLMWFWQLVWFRLYLFISSPSLSFSLVYDLKRTVVNQSKFPQYKISTKKIKVFFVLRHAAVGLDLLTFSLYCVPFSSAKHLFLFKQETQSIHLCFFSGSHFPFSPIV